MAITQQLDHAEQAAGLLLGVYQEKPRIRALLLSYVARCQELDDAIWGVIVKRLIDNAEAAQLDAIGRIVGEPRNGKVDALYRVYVLARIRINWSKGQPRDVIEVLRIVEAQSFRYREYYPASILIEYLGLPPAALPTVLVDLAKQAKPAGVQLQLVAPTASNQFIVTTVGGSSAPTLGLGHFGSVIYGGYLSSAYQ